MTRPCPFYKANHLNFLKLRWVKRRLPEDLVAEPTMPKDIERLAVIRFAVDQWEIKERMADHLGDVDSMCGERDSEDNARPETRQLIDALFALVSFLRHRTAGA